tara:strand:- start:126 stop:797 length:672 start_codon:yes stop_codon:yes gene_type:complete
LLDIPSPALKMASSTTTTADAIAATPTPPNSGLTPTSKSEPDVEKQDSFEKNGPNNLSTEVLEDAEPGLEDNSKVPRMSLSALFWFFFYNFGLFAWGGPVAQIALIKERLVIQDKWITIARFQRVFSVYQILPGPEAAELCMFFGCLSAGRIGGIVAGIAFILPGFILMLLASYLYSLAGFENVYFNASFRALQPIVAAMVWLLIDNLTSANQICRFSKLSTK